MDGRATATPVFIPAVVHEGQSLVAGDPAFSGHLAVMAPPSSCAAPKSAPATSGNEIRFYDVFTVRSLINEPACVWVAQIPRVNGGFCFGLALYSPTFDPANLPTNYVADDSSFGTLSATLAPGASAQAVIYDDGVFHQCADYGLMIGSDAPFATGRPQLAGGSTAGTPVTTTVGDWNGAPAFAQLAAVRRERRRLRPDRRGHRVGLHAHRRRRRRLHAAGAGDGDAGRALDLVRLGTDGRDRGSAAARPTAPRGTIRLGSRNLAKIVKSGRAP